VIARATSQRKSRLPARNFQIIIASAAFGISLIALTHDAVSSAGARILVAGVLLLLGVEQVISGKYLFRRSGFRRTGLGFTIIGCALVALVFGEPATASVVWLTALALAAIGFSSVISAVWASNIRGQFKEYSEARLARIGAGALSIAVSIALFAQPVLGLIMTDSVIEFALVICSLSVIVTGILGQPRSITCFAPKVLGASA
jgi:uncharacterized membrane protein HdeD (DUF308 family)